MFKDLLNALKTAETYTVRVLDEIVHHGINQVAHKVEKKGYNRFEQANILTHITWLGLAADNAYDMHQSLGKSATENAGFPIEIMKTTSILIPSAIDHFDYLAPHYRGQNTDGTADVHSYNSLGGIFRPYLLTAAIGTATYGFMNKEYGTMFWGLEAIPWILSFYTRDDQSGGLLQKLTMASAVGKTG